jgi:quinol monooxygenase YgiN
MRSGGGGPYGLASLTIATASTGKSREHTHDENRDLLTVVAYMRAEEGKTDELRAALEALTEPTSREEGYVNYDLHRGVEDARFFTFYENWLSGEHLDAHLASPHMVEFANKMGDLLDESGLTVNRVRRIARHRPSAKRSLLFFPDDLQALRKVWRN